MTPPSVCPLCNHPARLWDPGTTTPAQFFSVATPYAIAAGGGWERLPVYICQTCGHGFTPLGEAEAGLEMWYQQAAQDHTFLSDGAARRRTARRVLTRIAHQYGTSGKLLDIGAGPGFFVEEAVRAGWHAEGLEPSAWAAAYGNQQLKVPIQVGSWADTLDWPAGTWDVVTMFDVIEHVPEPEQLLKAAARLLKPHGYLVLTTPQFDSVLAQVMGRSWYCIFPEHLHYFTRRSLNQVLQASGFKLRRRYHHTRYLSIRYFLQRCLGFVRGTRVVAPLAVPQHSVSIPVNYGDEFEVYAQKISPAA